MSSTVLMPLGSSECPNPGCEGAITCASRASSSMKRSEPCMPMCGWRKRMGRPFPRRRISMFAPAIFSVAGLSAESMCSVHLDLRFAYDPAPARVFGPQQLAERRVGHDLHFRALIEQQLFRVGLREYAVDLAVQLRKSRARRRDRREQRVPDYHVEIRKARFGDRRYLRRVDGAPAPVVARPRSLPERMCGSTVGAAASI